MTLGVAELSPLHDRRFRVFAAGNVINNLGETAFTGIAPLLLASRSGAGAAGVFVVATGASSLASPFVGAAVDRWGWRRFFFLGLAGQAVSLAALVITVRSSVGAVAPFALVIVVNQICANSYLTGWKVGLGELFPRSRKRARATLNTAFYATGVVGPLLASLVLSAYGFVGFLLYDLVTFAAPVLALLVIGHPAKEYPPTASAAAPSAGLGSAVVTAVRTMHSDRRIRSLLAYFLCLAAMSGSVLSVLVAVRFDVGDRPLEVLAIVNLAVYVGNQIVSALRAVRPALAIVCGLVTATAGVALIPSADRLVCAAGIAMLGLAAGIGISYYVVALVEFSPTSLYGAISGAVGLFGGVAVVTSGAVVSWATATSLSWLYAYLAVLVAALWVAGVKHTYTLRAGYAVDGRPRDAASPAQGSAR